MSTQQSLLNEIEKKFFEKLEQKNSWGKNEVKIAYREAEIEVLRSYIDSKTKEK